MRTNPILSLRPVYASRPSLVSPAKEGVRGRGQRIQVSKVSGVFACIHAHPLLSHPAFTEDRQSCSARGARGRQQDTGSLKNSVHTSTADEDVIDDDDDEQKQSAYLASISRSVTLDSQFSSLPFPLSLSRTHLPASTCSSLLPFTRVLTSLMPTHSHDMYTDAGADIHTHTVDVAVRCRRTFTQSLKSERCVSRRCVKALLVSSFRPLVLVSLCPSLASAAATH